MRTAALSLTAAAALGALVALPAFAAEQIEEHRTETYNSEKTTVEPVAPAVRERTTVETVPAAPMVQKRTSETVVKEGKGHDSDTKVESKTKIEHDED